MGTVIEGSFGGFNGVPTDLRGYFTVPVEDNRFNGYCAACCMGFPHWHPEGLSAGQESLGWTWWTAMVVANALAIKERRRWRVRSIPIYKRGTDVLIGARYWPEPATPSRDNVVSGKTDRVEVQR